MLLLSEGDVCHLYICWELIKEMSLQTHSFFLDTAHAAPQGPGSWRFQLREPIDIRQNQVAHVDDITFRNSFPTVDVFSRRWTCFPTNCT